MQQSCTYGSVRGAPGQPAFLPRQKTHMLRFIQPISRQRTGRVRLRSSICRAPRLWIFLSSLQDTFFIKLVAGGPFRQRYLVSYRFFSGLAW
jgi:hypothetical protein